MHATLRYLLLQNESTESNLTVAHDRVVVVIWVASAIITIPFAYYSTLHRKRYRIRTDYIDKHVGSYGRRSASRRQEAAI